MDQYEPNPSHTYSAEAEVAEHKRGSGSVDESSEEEFLDQDWFGICAVARLDQPERGYTGPVS